VTASHKRGSVLVVGGGIGGIQTSLDLADQGFRVYLVEKTASIGGKMVQLDKTFPTNDCAMCMISPKLVACARHPNIEILTLADVETVAGEPGRFCVTVRQEPRSVDPTKCTGCGMCIEECPVRNVIAPVTSAPKPEALASADEAVLGPLVSELSAEPGSLLPALERLNAHYGYVPKALLEHLADRLGLPLAQALRVASFYHLLSLRRPGRHVIEICRGAACHLAGAGAILAHLENVLGIEAGATTADGLFMLRATHHVGYCAEAPVVRVDGQPLVRMTPEKIDAVLETLRAGGAVTGHEPSRDTIGGPAEHRVTLRNVGIVSPRSLDDYVAHDGFTALRRVVHGMAPEALIDLVSRSGLRGRGGAGFATGQKWALCRAAAGDPKHVVCNADEGNPGAFMDRVVLEGDPFRVLEGMTLGAWAIGARHGWIYVRAEYPRAVEILEGAIRAARERGLLGERILGSAFAFDVRVRTGAGAYVCGEETALLSSIETGIGEPRTRPPFPAKSGLWGKPTNVNNVKTWATVPEIVQNGAETYAALGTGRSRGTNVFSLSGHVNRPGVYEVAFGTTLRDLIEKHGGGVPGGRAVKGVQTGGPGGGIVPASLLDSPLDYERLSEAGSAMGSGGIIVLDDTTCMAELARHFAAFSVEESCGKCTPCREGTRRMLDRLDAICAGRGRAGDLETLERLGRVMASASLCGLGQAAPGPLFSILRHFRTEIDAHVLRRECPTGRCDIRPSAPSASASAEAGGCE
jgi:NADP-reducing hydrogenase subunit HndC